MSDSLDWSVFRECSPECGIGWAVLEELNDGAMADSIIEGCASLLSEQWPDVSVTTRVATLTRLRLSSHRNTTDIKQPATQRRETVLVLVDLATHQVVGHAHLAPAAKSSAILTSVLVTDSLRGTGLGRFLVSEAEALAANLSFEYMYLSTPDKKPFYEHLGYHVCKPISSLKSNAHRLNNEQRSRLENLFASRSASTPTSNSNIWLYKRLKEEHPFVYREQDEYLRDLQRRVRDADLIAVYLNVPWHRQIGPSCGLAALNMVRDFLLESPSPLWHCYTLSPHVPASSSAPIDEILSLTRSRFDLSLISSTHSSSIFHKDATIVSATLGNKTSLLQMSIQLGYSSDGEMFNASHLCQLAREYLGVKTELLMDDELSETELIGRLLQGQIILLPYDRSSNHEACETSGNNAHWLCIHGWAFDTSSSDVMVLASHGMSRHILCTSLTSLLKSNKQLIGPIIHEGDGQMVGSDDPKLASRACAIHLL